MSSSKSLTLIAAMTPSGVIGKGSEIPWKISEDLKRFKRLTSEHTIIMGRKTFESIGRPLPNRTNIVVSQTWQTNQDRIVFNTFEDALRSAHDICDDPFVIGGGDIYRLALPYATKLEITYVARATEWHLGGTAFFPITYPNFWHWRCTKLEHATEHEDVEFMTFERRTHAMADKPKAL